MFRLFLLVSLFPLALIHGLSVNMARAGDIIEVYLLGGQSNMSGVGVLDNLPAGYLPQPNVMLYHSDTTAGVPDVWKPNGPSGITGFGFETFGPEIGIGKRLSELRPGVDIALIKRARGGLNLEVDLNPGTFGDLNSQGLRYKELINTIQDGLAALQTENPGKEIQLKAMFWHQGEGDASVPAYTSKFESNFVNLIGRIREDIAAPDLPFIYGTISQRSSTDVNTVIDAQFRVDESSGEASATPGAHVLDFRNLPTHADLIDGFRDTDDTHFNAAAQVQMGRMYAEKFVATAIPEPSTSVMVLSGMLFMLCPRKKSAG